MTPPGIEHGIPHVQEAFLNHCAMEAGRRIFLVYESTYVRFSLETKFLFTAIFEKGSEKKIENFGVFFLSGKTFITQGRGA